MNLLHKFIIIAAFTSSLLSGCCILSPNDEPFTVGESLQQAESAKANVLGIPVAVADPNPIATAETSVTKANERIVQPRVSYTVSEGDLLWSIAKRPDIYGDPLLWPLIYQANRDQIKDPRKIYAGQTLSIPRNISESEREEARNRAKNSDFFPQEEQLR